jgi:hypothetical protein
VIATVWRFCAFTNVFGSETTKINLVKELRRLLAALCGQGHFGVTRMTNEFQHWFLITILRNSFEFVGDEKLNNLEYIARHENDIKRTGPVLEFLGLAEKDKQAPFGWKPTHSFFDIIARKGTRRLKQSKKPRTADEAMVANLFCAVASGEGLFSNDLGEALLGALGLFRDDNDGNPKPTRLLRKLYLEWFERNEG